MSEKIFLKGCRTVGSLFFNSNPYRVAFHIRDLAKAKKICSENLNPSTQSSRKYIM